MFREMRRDRQKLGAEECERILKTAKRGVLSLLGDGGYPYGVPMDFVYENGKIYFHSAVEGHKVDALKRCDRVSFCVVNEGEKEPGEWWYRFSSVIVFGRIGIVADEQARIAALRMLGLKFYPTEEEVDAEIKKDAARALILEIDIEHMSGKTVREK
ncbi:MAG: pyridoxamine 5'-phosphate oxidase family protein [Clostridia bacterium]|nr:pyridoxamine 5'-phosphate oxidase family protein [Clostridia bacterium]MBR5427928.1 pyridoxamine 5'-phosphate oxidase family protein [Clostridia bacterium]